MSALDGCMPRSLVARIGFIILVATVVLLLTGRGLITVRDAAISDFRCFWEAGRVVREGMDPFDRTVWAAATRADPGQIPPCDETFIYPMWTAIAFVPLSTVPESTALAGWEIFSFAATVISVALLARIWSLRRGGGWLLLLVLVSQPMYSAIANAQLGPAVLLLVCGLIVALARSRYLLAALIWCALLIKPHVVLLSLAGTVATVRSRTFVIAAVTGVTLIGAVSLLFAPSWPIELGREIVAQGRVGDRDLATFWGLAAAVGIPTVYAPVASAAALGVVAVLAPRRRLSPAELLALLGPASFLVTPYARSHDEMIFVVSWAALLACVEGAQHRQTLVVGIIAVAVLLPWIVALGAFGIPSASHVVVAFATACMVAVALPRRHELMTSAPVTAAVG